MSKINNYFENLKKETSPVKLFIPIFLGMTAVTELVGPAALYFIKTVWKHQEFVFPNPLYGLTVSLVFGVVLALIISRNHRAKSV